MFKYVMAGAATLLMVSGAAFAGEITGGMSGSGMLGGSGSLAGPNTIAGTYSSQDIVTGGQVTVHAGHHNGSATLGTETNQTGGSISGVLGQHGVAGSVNGYAGGTTVFGAGFSH